MTPVLVAVRDLSAAFAARDVIAALACFTTGDDIAYAGSEASESATGRAQVEALFKEVFSRDEAYSWQVTAATIREYRDCAYVYATAEGLARTDAGEEIPFAYRISGLLEPAADGWRWRHCHGCEPTAGPTPDSP